MSASPSPKAVTSALDKAEHGTAFTPDVDAIRGHIQAQAEKIAELEARVRTLDLRAQGAMAVEASLRTEAANLQRERDRAVSRQADMENSALVNAGRAADMEIARNEWKRRTEAAEAAAKGLTARPMPPVSDRMPDARATSLWSRVGWNSFTHGEAVELEAEFNRARAAEARQAARIAELEAAVDHAQAVNLADLRRHDRDSAALRLTLRDTFAMSALQVILPTTDPNSSVMMARIAYATADAMLVERAKTP